MVRTRSKNGAKGLQGVDEKVIDSTSFHDNPTQSNTTMQSRKRKKAAKISPSEVGVKRAKRCVEVNRKIKQRIPSKVLENGGNERDRMVNGLQVNLPLSKEEKIEARNTGSDEDHISDKIVKKEDIEEVAVKTEVEPKKKIGVHVSISGGLHNSVQHALDLGAKAFGLFLRNQRQWAAKPLNDIDAEKFQQAFQDAGFSPTNILPHGSYLMNCASPDVETLSRSREALIDELKRCERLGLTLYNFHPGSTCGKITADEGIQRIAESINRGHKETKYVITLIENMCCQGHTIGGKFEELKSIIDKVEDKTRIGVCFDTCHAFAAGYDISNKDALNRTMETFETVIGLKYLKAVHLNDSKGNCGCNLDRHENIGHGKIGSKGFKALMNDNRFDGIPMVLETPECDYSKEINKLYSLVCK